jgi:anti-sigma factor (TIGR02949 family)
MNVSNIDDRHCERYRQYVDAYLDQELPIEMQRDLQQHFASCPDCTRILDSRGRMKQLVRKSVSTEEVPLELVQGLRGQFQANPPGVFARNTAGWMAAAAAVLVVAIGGIAVLRWDRGVQLHPGGGMFQTVSLRVKEILRVGLADHIHCSIVSERWKQFVSLQQMKAASGSSALGPDFVDLVPAVASKLGSNYQVVGGHRCTAGGRKYVHILMTGSKGSILSLVVTQKQNGETFTEADAVSVMKASGVDIYQDRQEDLEIAGFESEKYLAYVVSNLDRDANLNLASSLAPVIYEHLHRLEL